MPSSVESTNFGVFKQMEFQPAFGFSSPHLQTILSPFGMHGKAPPSEELIVSLDDGDCLSCHISCPKNHEKPQKIVVMVHGLGGSYLSGYLIRLSRKIYQRGDCAVRVNLRNCGSCEATLPYNGGTSHDIFTVLKVLKERFPQTSIILLGFSLGGNIMLKLAGELGDNANRYMSQLIAVCPTIDLYHAVQHIEKKGHWFYHQYYLSHLLKQSKKWTRNLSVKSIYEFDDKVTAPLWGYKNAMDYYKKCSSSAFIDKIFVPTRILFAEDDPFIDCHLLDQITIPPCVEIYATQHGGHMGFLGWAGKEHGYYWMDKIIMKWINEG